MEGRAPATAAPPALPDRRRRRRFAIPLAMAPVLVLAIVATTAAGAAVIGRLAEGYPGIENPGQPLAGATMECMTPPEAAAFLAANGFTNVDWQVETGSVTTPDGGKGSSSSVHVTRPAGARLRHPRLAPAGWAGDHGRRPAYRGDRCRRLLRRPDAVTSIDTTAAARIDRAAASKGDPDAFEAAVRPHYANLIRRLVLVLGDERDAEDVAQDAYLKAFRSWDRFDGVDVRAWLYTIALRLAFNHLRGRRRWLAAIGRIEPRPWADPADPDLAAALATLDTRTRAALLLNVVDGYTQAEIARMLAVPEGTVASWISRGRATLRRELDPGR